MIERLLLLIFGPSQLLASDYDASIRALERRIARIDARRERLSRKRWQLTAEVYRLTTEKANHGKQMA